MIGILTAGLGVSPQMLRLAAYALAVAAVIGWFWVQQNAAFDRGATQQRIETAAATSEAAEKIAKRVEEIERETDADAARAAASNRMFWTPEYDRPVGGSGSEARPNLSGGAGPDPGADGRAGGPWRDRELAPLAGRFGDPSVDPPAPRAGEDEGGAVDVERELADYRWGAGFGITGFALLIGIAGFLVIFGQRWGITDWIDRAIERAFYTRGQYERGAYTVKAPTGVGATGQVAADADQRATAGGSAGQGVAVVPVPGARGARGAAAGDRIQVGSVHRTHGVARQLARGDREAASPGAVVDRRFVGIGKLRIGERARGGILLTLWSAAIAAPALVGVGGALVYLWMR